MKFNGIIVASTVTFFISQSSARVESYQLCGYHANNIVMTAYYTDSAFWVDLLVTEAQKWNKVHPILNISRSQTSYNSIPLGDDDGKNVVAFINESDLKRVYNTDWRGKVGVAINRYFADTRCARIIEADVFFNPSISNFVPQTKVPYQLGFQEIALHELGHMLTLEHEERTLSVMTGTDTSISVSNVLYASDKVGWLRSADRSFNITDRRDMGVFPLRNKRGLLGSGSNIYSTLSPKKVEQGSEVTIKDFTVENLSSALDVVKPKFKIVLENTKTNATTKVESFSWEIFEGYSLWSGDLPFEVPYDTTPGTYRVVAVYEGADSDSSNDRAMFGSIEVEEAELCLERCP